MVSQTAVVAADTCLLAPVATPQLKQHLCLGTAYTAQKQTDTAYGLLLRARLRTSEFMMYTVCLCVCVCRCSYV